MHSNARVEFFKKMCQATEVPYSVMWISPVYYVNILSMGNPLIPDAEKHLNQNYSENIIEINFVRRKCRRFGFPSVILCNTSGFTNLTNLISVLYCECSDRD